MKQKSPGTRLAGARGVSGQASRIHVRARQSHVLSSLALVIMMILLNLTLLTIFLLRIFPQRYIHETGLSVVYGAELDWRRVLACGCSLSVS
jgi:hypothetical protein